MKIIDISMSIHEKMMVYKKKEQKKPHFKVINDYMIGNTYETDMRINLHTGTHIDAPLHMIKDGDTIDQIDLKELITKCRVLDFTEVGECIKKTDLEKKDIKAGEFLLLKTKNSYVDTFELDFVYLEKSGADYLQKMNIKGVGIDALGVERSQKNHPTHKILLGSKMIIIEGLRLKGVKEGTYMIYALPLKLKGVEAAPARVILIEED
ncbi:MAG: cyclase family protein [Marinisporobacter sp.]|nr:cyclase family protein [Marinisporobacter sp.]